jgi:3-oxoadipate enol-lactonase
MVLLHALGEQASSWDAVVPSFAPSFSLAAIDLRGHGVSDWPGAYSFELMRDDVLGALDELHMREVVLVGHSMGGVIAYLVAQAEPGRVSRLIVEDAPPPYPRERAIPQRPEISSPFDWDVIPAIIEQVNDPSMKWWRRLPEISAPTLLIGGGATSHIPQDKLVEVARAIPDCTLITIPAGHNVHEACPTEFADAVLRWLGRAPLPPASHG